MSVAMHEPPTELHSQDLALLVHRIAAGEESAMDALYECTSGRMYGMALRMLRDTARAEEVTLDVYTQVWRQAATYRSERGSVLAWLVILVRSRALDCLRSQRAGSVQTESHALPSLEDAGLGPEAIAQEGDTAEQLQSALRRISDNQRDVLKAAFFGGMTHTEIATSMGIPLGTVKRRMRDGLERMRDLMTNSREEWA